VLPGIRDEPKQPKVVHKRKLQHHETFKKTPPGRGLHRTFTSQCRWAEASLVSSVHLGRQAGRRVRAAGAASQVLASGLAVLKRLAGDCLAEF
jgi:hypothetical protein